MITPSLRVPSALATSPCERIPPATTARMPQRQPDRRRFGRIRPATGRCRRNHDENTSSTGETPSRLRSRSGQGVRKTGGTGAGLQRHQRS